MAAEPAMLADGLPAVWLLGRPPGRDDGGGTVNLIRLELPVAISKNRLYDNATRWTKTFDADGSRKRYMARKLSAEYEAYKREVWAMVMQQTTPEQREALQSAGKLSIHYWLRYPGNSRDHDACNAQDALMDALKDALGVDDERYWAGTWRRLPDGSDGPACTVLIAEMEGIE